jgi:hypothetical protein
MLAVDIHTRRIVGFAAHAGDVNGIIACPLFNQILGGRSPPARISTDHNPIFKHHRWQATLRVLGIDEVKTVPYTPLSHPFVERTIGTVRREFLDRTLFWNEADLSRKLAQYKTYYNEFRGHLSLGGKTPVQIAEKFLPQTAHSQLQLDLPLQWSIQDTDCLLDLEFARHTHCCSWGKDFALFVFGFLRQADCGLGNQPAGRAIARVFVAGDNRRE